MSSNRSVGSLDALVQAAATGRITRRTLLARAMILGVSATMAGELLAACQTGSGNQGNVSTTPTRGGVLKAAYSGVPDNFDPATATLGTSHQVIEHIYDTLVELDGHASPQPGLASSWDISGDALTYTFHLRQNVSFHNGDVLTADDVKFTFDRLLDPKTGYPFPQYVNAIESVVVVDPGTVRFTTKTPFGPFLVYMAFPGASIVPKKVVQSGGNL